MAENESKPKACCGGDEPKEKPSFAFTKVDSCCQPETVKTERNSSTSAVLSCGEAKSPRENHVHESDDLSCCSSPRKIDWILWLSSIFLIPGYLLHWLAPRVLAELTWLQTFSAAVFELLNKMWWGLALGIVAVGVLSSVPKELVISLLGKSGSFGGLLRATAAGTLFDLCSHGILLVGMQLYRRGASLGQTMAFLIASPWNSLSLTVILISLIGWKWTLAFLLLSIVVALISGLIFEGLVRRGTLPANPNRTDLPDDFRLGPEIRKRFRETRFHSGFFLDMARSGLSESRMILRWIFFGTVLAGVIRASMTAETFGAWFGPTIGGLLLTLFATTVIEVCSEGSSPIAGDLLNRGGAPGNAFTFLMAGVATDYTEILSLKETTRSWKISLFLPLITVPQIIVIGWLINHFGAG